MGLVNMKIEASHGFDRMRDKALRVCGSLSMDVCLVWKRPGMVRSIFIGCLCLCSFLAPLSAEEITYHAFGNPELDAEGRAAVWRYQGMIIERWRKSGQSIGNCRAWMYQWEDDWEEAFNELENRWKRFKDPGVKKAIGAFLAELVRSKDVRKSLAAMAAVGAIELIDKADTAWRCWSIIERLETAQREIELWEDVIEWRECLAWEPILEKRRLI